MVIGIAGGLDLELPIGSLMVPERVQLYPDGPVFNSHPVPPGPANRTLMTTDGLFDDDDVWRPLVERGFSAVDMEAAGGSPRRVRRPVSTGRSIAASVIAPTSTSWTRLSSP